MRGSDSGPEFIRPAGDFAAAAWRRPALCGAWWLGLLLFLAGAPRVQAQFEFAVARFAITNYTGYVLNGDAGPDGRQAIRTLTSMFFTNASSTSQTVDFQLAYQLVDSGGAPVSILDENGHTNTTYSVFETNTLPRVISVLPPLVIHSFFVTNTAPLQPLVQLDPYQDYTARFKVYARPHATGLYTYTGTNASTLPRVFYNFTNTVSPDPGPNLLLTLDSATLGRTWAISNSPGQGGFPLSVAATVRRYDDFTLPPVSTNTSVTFNFTLLDTSTGTAVPLQQSQSVVSVSIDSHDSSAPPLPSVVPVVTNFSLVPAVQLDSVDKTYQILVTLTHTEGNTVVMDHTNSIGPVQLLAFNGQLLAGTLLTYFTNLDSAPTITNSVPNDHLDCLLPVSTDAGWLPGAPGHTYGDGTAIPVSFFVNGTCQLQPGATVNLHGPSPDTHCVQNICFQLSSLQLTSSGASGFVVLDLPAGFSVGVSTSLRTTIALLEYPGTVLDQNLNPQSSLTTPGPFYAVEETLPFWFQVPSLTWNVTSGQIILNPTGGVFVRQVEDDILSAARPQLVDPHTANRVSNDTYFRNVGFNGGSLVVTADSNGAARVSTQLALNPPDVRPHFPYSGNGPGQQIPATSGTFVLQDGLVSSNSFLQVSGPVPVSYARDCEEATNCSLAQIGPATLAFTPSGNQLEFTIDGGLLAYGSVPATSLAWGYVSGANFAQQASTISAGAYEMAGTFLRGDQTTLGAAEHPAELLFSGFGDASDPTYLERPDQAVYALGEANYSGLNFRAPANGQSYIAQTSVGPYPLTARSKYYARFGGVSGIHESATFPSTLQLYGYNFTFTTYRLSYLDSDVWESRTDGAIVFPPMPTGPAGFTQAFKDMTFTCRGDLESADLPSSSGKQHLAYWNVDITPESIQFKPSGSDTCGTGPRWLVLGVETTLPFIPQALQASLGFWPNGNLVTPADNVAGTDSRFEIPAQLSLQGTAGDIFPLSTAAKGYFNNWATTGAPASGFYNLAGTLRVPFFSDIKVQLHITPLSATDAQIAIMGGWPAADSQATDLGWTVSGNNYFNTTTFDPTSDGWPAAQVNVADYENSPTTQYRPRAQADWIEVAYFDYPLQWNPALRNFSGFGDAQVVLPIINVNSHLNELSPGVVNFNFAQDISLKLPQVQALDFLNDAVNEVTGPLLSVSNAVRSALGAALDTSGVNELQQTLREDAQAFFQPALNATFGPVVDQLYNQFTSFPQSDPNAFLSNAVYQVNNGTLSTVLGNLNGVGGQAGSIVGQLDGTLNDVQRDLGVLLQVLAKAPDGSRHAISAIIEQLASDQGPALGLVGSLADSEVDLLVTNLNPTLDAIQSQLLDLSNQLAQVHSDLLNVSGNFNQALSEPFSDAAGVGQFVQSAATDLTNLFATVLTPAGDYFTANPAAARQAIQQELINAFLGSSLATDYQQTLKQFLFDPNATLDQLMDTLFDQINGAIRDGFADQITDAGDSALQAVKGLASGSFLAAKITGSPTFNGDSLRKIHLDAAIQVNLPDPLNFNAYMEILELDSQSVPVDCVPPGAPAAEVTLGADNVTLDWPGLNPSGVPLTLGVNAKWTLQSGNVIGVGGSFDIKGKVGFEGCSVNEIGAAIAFGATENYFAAKAAGTVSIIGIPVDVQAGVFVGKACSLDPLTFIDPNADQVLGGNATEFNGIYVQFGAGLSLSDILFGGSSCFLDVGVTVDTAVYYNGGPSKQQIGMRQQDALDLSLLCVLSGNASLTMFGSVTHSASGDEVDLGGSAQICGSIGPCPFCISGCKGITVTGTVNSGGIDYHVDY